MGYQPKVRPVSDMTLFKGRPILGQSWDRIPEPELPRSPIINDDSLESFDFKLPNETLSAARTSNASQRESSPEPFRTKTYDWRMNA